MQVPCTDTNPNMITHISYIKLSKLSILIKIRPGKERKLAGRTYCLSFRILSMLKSFNYFLGCRSIRVTAMMCRPIALLFQWFREHIRVRKWNIQSPRPKYRVSPVRVKLRMTCNLSQNSLKMRNQQLPSICNFE